MPRMSETLLKFMLDELQIVRVICRKPGCGAILESKMSDLARFFAGGRCTVCGEYLHLPNDKTNQLAALARVMGSIAASKDLFQVEFVLPQNQQPTEGKP